MTSRPVLNSRAERSERRRRHSAGGMALHAWDQKGKLTTIHVVYELASPVKRSTLCAVLDERLLRRFPRFRGHVDPQNQYYWVIPDRVDPQDYVEEVELSHTTGQEAALLAHIAEQMRLPLPEGRSWQVQILSIRGAAPFLLWRISHTIADGVVIAQVSKRAGRPAPSPARRADAHSHARRADHVARAVRANCWPGRRQREQR